MSVTYSSRLPAIALELAVKLDAVGNAAAERTADDARENVAVGKDAPHIKDDIRVERTGIGEHTVIAGDTNTFYGHILENGGVNHGAQPFLVPAAEKVRGDVDAIAKTVLRGL